jgi:hypothetical protein
MKAAAAAMPKGCCKAPDAPKPSPGSSRRLPLSPRRPTFGCGPLLVSTEVPVLVVAHGWRARASRASPDDLLSRPSQAATTSS